MDHNLYRQLKLAARMGHLQILEDLIVKHGVSLKGNTPQDLLEEKINVFNPPSNTTEGLEELIKLLVKLNPTVNCDRSIHILCMSGQLNNIKIIMNALDTARKYVWLRQGVGEAISNGHLNVVEYILSKDTGLKERDLPSEILSNHTKMRSLLLERLPHLEYEINSIKFNDLYRPIT